MALGTFGRKIGMTHIFDEFGFNIPVTLIKIEPCTITQIKNTRQNHYQTIQLGYFKSGTKRKLNETLPTNLEKPSPKKIISGEFSVPITDKYNINDIITVDNFTEGQLVKVSGKSNGKGFSGNQRRHNFSRGPMTHGSKNHRAPGSIGAGTTPGRVYPGKKMAGQCGNKKVTIKNTRILVIHAEENILVLQGSLVGKTSTILKITPMN